LYTYYSENSYDEFTTSEAGRHSVYVEYSDAGIAFNRYNHYQLTNDRKHISPGHSNMMTLIIGEFN